MGASKTQLGAQNAWIQAPVLYWLDVGIGHPQLGDYEDLIR